MSFKRGAIMLISESVVVFLDPARVALHDSLF